MSLRRISILPNYLYFRFLNGLVDLLNLHERGGPVVFCEFWHEYSSLHGRVGLHEFLGFCECRDIENKEPAFFAALYKGA